MALPTLTRDEAIAEINRVSYLLHEIAYSRYTDGSDFRKLRDAETELDCIIDWMMSVIPECARFGDISSEQ